MNTDSGCDECSGACDCYLSRSWDVQHIYGWSWLGVGKYVLHVGEGDWWSMWVLFVGPFAFSVHGPPKLMKRRDRLANEFRTALAIILNDSFRPELGHDSDYEKTRKRWVNEMEVAAGVRLHD